MIIVQVAQSIEQCMVVLYLVHTHFFFFRKQDTREMRQKAKAPDSSWAREKALVSCRQPSKIAVPLSSWSTRTLPAQLSAPAPAPGEMRSNPYEMASLQRRVTPTSCRKKGVRERCGGEERVSLPRPRFDCQDLGCASSTGIASAASFAASFANGGVAFSTVVHPRDTSGDVRSRCRRLSNLTPAQPSTPHTQASGLRYIFIYLHRTLSSWEVEIFK